MRNWDESDEVGDAVCPHTAELKVARKVCEQLDIPLLEVDFVQVEPQSSQAGCGVQAPCQGQINHPAVQE